MTRKEQNIKHTTEEIFKAFHGDGWPSEVYIDQFVRNSVEAETKRIAGIIVMRDNWDTGDLLESIR